MNALAAVVDNPQIIAAPGGDQDAAEIGWLYRASRSSLVNSMKYALECGQRLIAKKEACAHGEWLPWLKANENALGFKERAARLLMRGASNRQLTTDLDEATAVTFSRKLWGNDNTRGTQGTGENEWYTPADIIAVRGRFLASSILTRHSPSYNAHCGAIEAPLMR